MRRHSLGSLLVVAFLAWALVQGLEACTPAATRATVTPGAPASVTQAASSDSGATRSSPGGSAPRPSGTALPTPSPIVTHWSSPTPRPTVVPTPSATRTPLPTVVPEPVLSNVEMVSHVGGAIEALVVQGDYAYAGGSYGFSILDVSDPKRVTQVSYTRIPVADLGVLDSYVYIAGKDSLLYVIDASNPASPVELASYELPGEPRKLMLSADAGDGWRLAFMLLGEEGLRIIDLSDPQSLSELGELHESDKRYYDLALTQPESGPLFAYLNTSRGVQVVDLTDLARPRIASMLDEPTGNLVAVSTYLYVSLNGVSPLENERSHVLDVSRSTAPQSVGTFKPAFAHACLGDDGYLYVMSLGGNVGVIDVSDPAGPHLVGSSEPDFDSYAYMGEPRLIAAAGHYVYAVNERGLYILDVTHPVSPVQAGFYDTMPYAMDVSISGKLAYIAQGVAYNSWNTRGALSLVNVSDPAVPMPVGRYDLDLPAYSTTLANGHAYLRQGHCSGWAGYCCGELAIFDLAQAPAIRQVGRYWAESIPPTPPDAIFSEDWFLSGVSVVDEWAYMVGFPLDQEMTQFGGGLRILHITNWITPTATAVLTAGVSAPLWVPMSLAVVEDERGRYAYVADYDVGLRIIDLADRLLPRQVANYPVPMARSVVAANRLLYVESRGEMLILDISDPLLPRKLSAYDLPGGVDEVIISESLAYVVEPGRGIHILDVSDPERPVEAGSYHTTGFASGLAISDGYIYVADYEGGLVVLRFLPPK